MSHPTVDLIIPVHTDQRPIARAVASVLDGTVADVRVNVVCHNIAPARVESALGHWSVDSRVRLLSHWDDIPSPAGPINSGYSQATGKFTALLDSDDEYEPGALDAWLAVQQRDDADVVIQPLRHADGRSKKSPPKRPARSRSLDGVKDRLAYRTRQHGLVRRARFPGLAMTPGLRTGEDVIQGVTLWYSGARISFAKGTPAYVIHDDSDDRTSVTPKSAAESLLFLDFVLAADVMASLTPDQKEAFAIKVLRTHIMDVLGASLNAAMPRDDLAAVADAAQRLLALAPAATRTMSVREARILAALTGDRDLRRLSAERARLYDYRRPSNVMPASIRKIFHREAPLRFLVASAAAP